MPQTAHIGTLLPWECPVRRIRLVTLIVLTAACAAQRNPASDAAATLRRADSAYTVGMQSLDVPGLVALYTADAVMYPPGEPSVVGIDAVRKFAQAFAAIPGLKMTAERQTIVVSQSGDLGYVVNLVGATSNDARGKPTTELLRDVHIWRRDADGQWKVAVDVWNVVPPGPTP